MKFLNDISDAIGVPEPILRLLSTILFAYPLALVYRFVFLRPIETKWAPFIRNLYIVIVGLGLNYYYNKSDMIHSFSTTVLTWFFCYFGDIIGNRKISVILTFTFHLGYLSWGYYITKKDDYDVGWTMTQCVLCLRMIGFSMDFWDGEKLKLSNSSSNTTKTLNKDNSTATTTAFTKTTTTTTTATTATTTKTASNPPTTNSSEKNQISNLPKQPISFERNIQLIKLPSLFETIGYAHFFGAFLIGPQFSFHLYRKFLTASVFPINKIPSGSYRAALKSLTLGALYLGAYQIGAAYFPIEYLITKEYAANPFYQRLIIMWFTGKFAFTKYLGIWTIAEGSCILSGISFNNYNNEGKAEWNGLANVDKWKFEFATSLSQIVVSFNTNTNFWTKTYIFKRLMFLGNKNLSSIFSLIFLAVWHGLHSGYYFCFSLEFFDMEAEKRWAKRFEKYTKPLYSLENKNNPRITYLRYLHQFICWIGQTCALHYAMISFQLLQYERCLIAYNSVYWIGHLTVFSCIFLDIILPKSKSKVMVENNNINIKTNGDLVHSKKEN
ncbi:hypothetical protein Glove_714g4 [Diversispora epigaea]|uniref:Lysophospholipid acyltransferase 5 n=1 Tax=Diversispora epigaea TaxID=1348612 RepID=A0A397G0U3_9GLOM|nr:hypothetical protein Glove_714g4 [Diversispora epigaea]